MSRPWSRPGVGRGVAPAYTSKSACWLLDVRQVSQHDRAMTSGVLHVVRLANHPTRVDQVGEPLRKVCERVVSSTNHFVGGSHFFACVGQQRVTETLGVLERLVVLRSVKRCAENDTTSSFKCLGTVTQALTLQRSTRCRSLWVPPQKNPLASLIGQAHSGSILIGQRKGWCRSTCLQHMCVLS
jgi:hypothetical protein